MRSGRYTAGVATRYSAPPLTGPPTHQGLAEGFTIGMRFHSAPVIRLADAKPVHLGHVARADGRWRLYAFADEAAPGDPSSRLRALCEHLEHSLESPLRRYTPTASWLPWQAFWEVAGHEPLVWVKVLVVLFHENWMQLVEHEPKPPPAPTGWPELSAW